ncbi:uncharacterized protein LTHEOB_7322 [Lasiodiplodia theobromae]|uniref:uncharacterized protein n=1 Tax=Lasiodiplodia theobromae TaxID=45133 RepID=UPI0015C2FC3B|nr:uncharacterized protein LTHEOB_7322 [Lasiodiplodia theobromae]KAF4542592.1 hypothetical protein LTHEOB_7322 [Lasiodiplodia theobromae]
MLHLSVSSSIIRLLLRVYFTVIVVAIALLGDVCCNLWVRRQLLRRRPVKLTHMTGWQRGFMPYWLILKLRAMPGGIILGSLMIMTSILAVFSDLAVSALVLDQHIPGTCMFRGGMVVASDHPSASDAANTISIFPDINGEAFGWAMSAQYYSVLNGGPNGIYRRVDDNLDFRARDPEDMLGSWVCEYETGDALTPLMVAWDTAYIDVVNGSVAAGKLYPYTQLDQIRVFTDALANDPDPTDYSQLFALTASTAGYHTAEERPGDAWDVRALIDWNRTGTAERSFDVLHCTVGGADKAFVDEVLAHVDAAQALASWAAAVQGSMYRGVGGAAYNDTATRLVKYLNAMVMVAASEQRVDRLPNPLDRVGCMVEATEVPALISALVLLTAAVFAWLCAYNAFLLVACCVYKSSYRKDARKKVWDQTPGSLTEWMAYALRESRVPAAHDAMPKHLKGWNFVAELSGAAWVRFSKRDAAESPVSVQYEYVQPPKVAM